MQHLIICTPAIAHDIEGKPFVTGGVNDGEVTDSAEILDSEGDQWLPYEHANVSRFLVFEQFLKSAHSNEFHACMLTRAVNFSYTLTC